MKKFRTTGKSQRKKLLAELRKPRSNSNPKPYDTTSGAWSSTDPKDLPEGFTVGSMSVPYSPPYLTQQSDPFGTYPRKGKMKAKSKKKAKKDHTDGEAAAGGSPLFKVKMAGKAAGAKESPKLAHVKKVPITDQDDGFLKKQKDFTDKAMHLQRSRSVDNLDDIGKNEDPENTEQPRRKSSLEYPSLTPRRQKGLTYHGDMARESLKQFHRELSRAPSVPHKNLHKPKSVESFTEVLTTGIEVNTLDIETGDAPIHAIIKRKKKDRLEYLIVLLTNSDADVNLANRREMAPLHLAVEEGDEMCVKALIVFGANINQRGCNQFTPLDLAIDNGKVPEIEELLLNLGAKSGTQLIAQFNSNLKVPRMYSFAEKMAPPRKGQRFTTNDRLDEFINRRGAKKLYHELEMNINRKLSFSASIGGSDESFALVSQQRELALYNKTLRQSKKSSVASFNPEGGSRLLFLDGGGMKGLAEIEVLMQLEERTKCKITELFDWIIGASTGAIIALAMVYGKKSLMELRQLFFLLKNRIFSKARYGFGYNTDNLEEILKEYLDPSIRMSDVTHPKVLIAAVNKATTNLELRFFNNCFGDEYSDYPVWRVARYTSAAPMMFSECDDYVDGGVLCNNPTDCGLTAIQNFYRLQEKKFPIALVVSIGSGIYPAEKLGSVDAQDFLYFGKQWLNPSELKKRTQSLFALLANAIGESEMVAENSKSRCEEQNIPFYRFSATLDDIVTGGETDNEKLFNMVLQTKMQAPKQRMDDLVEMFHLVAEFSKRIADIEEEPVQNESPLPKQKELDVSASISPKTMISIGEVADVQETRDPVPKQSYEPQETEHRNSQQSDIDTQEDSSVHINPNMNEQPTSVEQEAQFISKVKKEDSTVQLASVMNSSEHSTPPISRKQQDDMTASSHSELYKSYRLATQEPLTEEDFQQQKYTAYKLETLV